MASFLVSSRWEMWTLTFKKPCPYPCKNQDFFQAPWGCSHSFQHDEDPSKMEFWRLPGMVTTPLPWDPAPMLIHSFRTCGKLWDLGASPHWSQTNLWQLWPCSSSIPRAVQQLDGAGNSVLSSCNLCFDMWGNLCNSCLFYCRCDPFEQDPTFWKPKCLNDFVDYACSKPCVQCLN